ncbi:MAG: DNA repair protein RadA [Anaerolineaceae bacterium]|nr:DNA repair protein RadA [Anaerolineaceae bacterium]
MAKSLTHYVCQSCGRTSPKFLGRCPGCGAYGTMVEEVNEELPSLSTRSRSRVLTTGSLTDAVPQRLKDVDEKAEPRIETGISELSQVLGGGIVPGSVILISGDPGIGKSTLLLQTAMNIAQERTLLYVSGEESERQIKMRAARLIEAGGRTEIPDKLLLLTETSLNHILHHVKEIQPDFLIIDSIQTMQLDEIESTAGSITQVRECAGKLRELAKMNNITVFMIGHVTKEGNIAGPRILEHIVDTVLYLEGDRFMSLRLLRSVKNRYGATSEVGVFEMLEEGLVEVKNPSEVFLAERMVNAPGSAIVVTMEGTRPLLVEIQGLTNPVGLGNPRRTPIGVDINRLFLITAVLTRRIGVRLGEQDVFVNVVGGMRIAEPAADLAIAAAIVSSAKNQPVRADAVLIGEVGLSGELRGANKITARLNEAAKLGFTMAVIPRVNQKTRESFPKTMQVIEARSLREALKAVLLPDKDSSQ